MFFIGGQRVLDVGWLNPQAVYVDFEPSTLFASGWLWQLYSNRSLIGCTREAAERRVIGQLDANLSPAPLTLVRVDPGNFNTDYGGLIPSQPWNLFALYWTTSGSSGIDHFDIVGCDAPGGSIDTGNVIARVPFTVDGPYSFELDPLAFGFWVFGVIPRSNSKPLGTPGTMITASLTVIIPPDDVAINSVTGQRFSLASTAGAAAVGFSY